VASDFTIKRWDRLPSIAATLTDALGAPVDISSSTVKFIMSPTPGGGTPIISASAVIVNGAGQVRYDWLTADTDVSGSYVAEWEVTFPNGKKQTFPSASYNTVLIFDDLDNA
jgi:hypothetical protein